MSERDRLRNAVEVTAMFQNSNCGHPRCVRGYCDGLVHRNLDGETWEQDCRIESPPKEPEANA